MQTKINIEGMACNHCVASVSDALKNTCGVTEAVVSLEEKWALITFDENKVSRENLVSVICDLGFDAE